MVGIRHSDQSEARAIGKDAPSVWFASIAPLLRVIRDAKPRSLTELAELTERKVSNLSRTVKTMASYGLVELKRNNRDVRPIALATEFLVVLD